MSNPCLAYIRGLPDIPTIREINIRSGPNTGYDLLFKSPVGTSDLPVLDVRVDDKGANLQGKTYQWFQLQFPNGQKGWGRDDLLEISGDATAFGYRVLSVRTFAFSLTREFRAPLPVEPPAPVMMPAAPVAPTPTTSTPAPAAPTMPAAPVAPTVPTAPAAPAPVAPVPAPTPSTGVPTAIIKTQGAANTRFGPGTSFQRTGITLPRHGRFPLVEVQREPSGQNYRWFKVNNNGQQVWIREDLVTYDGDTAALGLAADLYPAPMKENYWWVRGYNMPPNMDNGLVQHDGWDLGAATGEPMFGGPRGGLVVKSFQCPKCTPEKPSTLMNGLSLGDASVFSDPGWGNGYGTHMIVRYTNDQLPDSTRALLATRGFPGGTMFVMYAHLQMRLLDAGATVNPGQQIATCGNTGNSEATHLHLEIRASRDANFTHWANIRSGVMDPVALFKR
ncbi:MAG: peptidoglycan DD-metalloendopeptidase family protein [Anaerolineae bacterium]